MSYPTCRECGTEFVYRESGDEQYCSIHKGCEQCGRTMTKLVRWVVGPEAEKVEDFFCFNCHQWMEDMEV